MKIISLLFALTCAAVASADVVLENARCRLTLGEDGTAKSLIVKANGEECLDDREDLRVFSVVQDRPFNNEIKLVFPNKRMEFRSNRLRREGDLLYVGFELISYEAVLKIKETKDYILFELKDFKLGPKGTDSLAMTYPPVDVLRILSLPVKNREHFGDWLNVSWDDDAAIAVVAGEPYTWIEHTQRHDFQLLTGEAHRDLKLRGAKVALIVGEGKDDFLNAMDGFERGENLPLGVESRRNKALNESIYHTSGINPENVDRHIANAKRGGFKNMLIYHTALCIEDSKGGDYRSIADYKPKSAYPKGYESIREMLDKIKAAGIRPGLHILQTFIGFDTHYVTPVADYRLNLKQHFTLAKPLACTACPRYQGTNRQCNVTLDGGRARSPSAPDSSTCESGEVWVQEDPSNAPTNTKSRILRFGGELLSYEGFTTERPYKFTGVKRGHLKTNVVPHPLGEIGGVLDVCEFGAQSCYIDQNTDLQDEVAEKIAKIYDCGFEFMYNDGSEGVNVPQGIHVPNAQYRVLKKLATPPLFTEGAAKGHWGWHFQSGANAFDVFPPEIFKDMIVRWPLYEAPIMAQDFTRLNFGWWHPYMPGHKLRDGSPSIGTQPDMWEFGSSKGAAWNCPATIKGDWIHLHPRVNDLLEVMRRWEIVRENGYLTDERKEMLRDPKREFHLIPDGDGFKMVEWKQLEVAGSKWSKVRAFYYEGDDDRLVVVYWHTSGKGTLVLPNGTRLEAENMKEQSFDLDEDELRELFAKAMVL